jgi:hypothetical protein
MLRPEMSRSLDLSCIGCEMWNRTIFAPRDCGAQVFAPTPRGSAKVI